jgi:hypothetical protein
MTTGVDIATDHAARFCRENPGWQMICDIPNSDALYETWEDLPGAEKRRLNAAYPGCGEAAYREFCRHRCKVPSGHIGEDGVFYEDITQKPFLINTMMVFKTSELANWMKRK